MVAGRDFPTMLGLGAAQGSLIALGWVDVPMGRINKFDSAVRCYLRLLSIRTAPSLNGDASRKKTLEEIDV
jgi:hypothetical protein